VASFVWFFGESLQVVFAEEAPIILEKAKIDTHDPVSIQRGAQAFANYCLICHTLDYMQHDPFAKRAGIIPSRMPDKNKKWWFGAVPPNLSLITRVHSADWLYTYLHSFYRDPSRPIGSNNLLQPDVNMPDPFVALQGEQRLVVKSHALYQENNLFYSKEHYYTILELTRQGSMTPDQFDRMINDLVNFLVYAGEPKKFARENMGIGVLIFLAILFILLFALKKLYWKKIN
jgi:ubiquinol-cytochrome c reductase cytochrome c1 subunit